VVEGEDAGTLHFPLSVYRLVMAAAGNRDFNALHHNSEFAKNAGAPEMFANTFFLQGMWERLVRAFIGPAGSILKLGGFRMVRFNTVGDTVIVTGSVAKKWREDGRGMLRIDLCSENSQGLSAGPGYMIASLPLRP
jgi:acyl dehydratase